MLELQNIYTLPSHSRQGAGVKLTQAVMSIAEKGPTIYYLEATPMGYGVYLKCGFEEVDHIELDLTPYGGSGLYRHFAMIRCID